MLAEGGGEAVGSAFDKVLRHALSPLDAPTLLRAAARYDLEPHRLRFLRRTLSSRGGASTRTRTRTEPEPEPEPGAAHGLHRLRIGGEARHGPGTGLGLG